MLAPQRPRTARPVGRRRAFSRGRLQWEYEACRPVESLPQQAGETRALGRTREIGLQRVDIGRQLSFGREQLRYIFVRSDHIGRIETELVGKFHGKPLRGADVGVTFGS